MSVLQENRIEYVPPDYVRLIDVPQYVPLSVDTVRKYVDDGRIQAIRFGPRIFVRGEEIIRIQKEGC